MKWGAGETVIKSLELEGTEHVFGVLGSAIMELFDLIDYSDQLSYVGARHEDTAIHMAHGYARAGGKMAVTFCQTGAGVTNQVTGMATALRAHVPTLTITGGGPNSHVDTGDRHEIDQLSVVRPVTKWAARVPRANRIPEYVQRAYRIATTPPYGPVFLEIPSDQLHEVFDWEPPAGTNEYRATYQAMVNPEAIGAVADLVAKAARPVFVVGTGGESEQAWADLAELSEREQIALTTTFGHASAIPRTPLALGSLARQGSKAAMRAVADADLVVIVGSRVALNSTIPYHGFRYWPDSRSAKIVQVDSNGENVGRHRRIDLGIVSDAAQFLSALRSALAAREPVDRSEWRSHLLSAKAEWEEERFDDTVPATRGDGAYLKPPAVYAEAGRVLGDEALFVTDVGSSTAFSFRMIDYGQPKGLIYTGAMAGVGFGMPASLGVKLARPDRPVVAMIGDGAFSLSLPSLLTAVEHQIPVRIVVCDNQSWGAEKAHQQFYFDKHYIGSTLKNANIVDIAAGIGASAVQVESLEALAAELKEEPANGPKVIVAPADPEDYPHPTVRHERKEATRFHYK